MDKHQLNAVADGADLVVNGYAMTWDHGLLRVLNLHRPSSSAVFDSKYRLIETTMDDIEAGIVQEYVSQSAKYLEDSVA